MGTGTEYEIKNLIYFYGYWVPMFMYWVLGTEYQNLIPFMGMGTSGYKYLYINFVGVGICQVNRIRCEIVKGLIKVFINGYQTGIGYRKTGYQTGIGYRK